MNFRRAQLLCLCLALASPAKACGLVAGLEMALSARDGEILFADGPPARLGGLWLAPGAAPALAALAGKRFGVALLAPAPDRWGRRVVDLVDAQGRSVALDLIARGLALARPETDMRDCAAERLDAEAGARAAGEGFWADRNGVLDAADAVALAKADGRFVLVEGVVRRVGEGRAKVYLDFAGRNGFSVLAAKKVEPSFRRSGVDLKALAGRRVLVRGVMDVRFGPRIEIADPSMIELSDSAKGAGRGE